MTPRRMLFRLSLLAAALPRHAAEPVLAAPAPSSLSPLPLGAVVSLANTPHLWIADERGVLHWAGDTRALDGRYVDWSEFNYRDRRETPLAQLRAYPLGDPWLSSGLLKDGDPIYLSKWEADEPVPTLLHIRSLADVQLFGINARNYGAFVLERPEWERRHGMSAAGLARGTLAPAAG
jgi:hypothetical protein